MNQKKLGIVVILKNKFIKGIVTDGDLRRELKNYSKDRKIKDEELNVHICHYPDVYNNEKIFSYL